MTIDAKTGQSHWDGSEGGRDVLDSSLDPKSLSAIDSDWDCVVIGGGPAGAMAARQMAAEGFSTLVVERKSYPREKVCGACLNHRAIAVLNSVGLGGALDDCDGAAIDGLVLRGYGHEFQRRVPAGVAISRARLDAALMDSAVHSGAICLFSTTAKVSSTKQTSGQRIVHLSQGQEDSQARSGNCVRNITAKVVIAADGLGHPSLRSLPQFHERIATNSRVGIGASVQLTSETWVRPGSIHMAVAKQGYAGVVYLGNGRLNLAAAVNPSFLKGKPSPLAFNQILREAGFGEIDSGQARWIGTPLLSRMAECVADDRVLTVGDAAGYVEPFTGEGMTWALIGGMSITEAAGLMIRGDTTEAAALWRRTWGDLVFRRQKWCRRLAWLLQHPYAAKLGVSVVARYPSVTNAIVNQLNLELSV